MPDFYGYEICFFKVGINRDIPGKLPGMPLSRRETVQVIGHAPGDNTNRSSAVPF
jgi:hypothetical protein